jgi:hypothetical protein
MKPENILDRITGLSGLYRKLYFNVCVGLNRLRRDSMVRQECLTYIKYNFLFNKFKAESVW